MLFIFEQIHLASQERSSVPKMAMLEFKKKKKSPVHLLPSKVSSTNLCFETFAFNKFRNGKSLEEAERGEGKVSRRGVKSRCFITEPPAVATKTDETLLSG